MFRANNFDKLLDKATSNLRLDPDWPTILQICDLIRQNDCTPKYAVAAIKKKLYSQNPHQAMFALLTLESVVKNCGSGIHDEIASKTFCETLHDLVKSTQHENLKTKTLELIQAWAFAFRNTQKYRAVQDTVNILKAEGFKFPHLKESDAMFSADTAPEWADGEVCHRCRVAFSLMVRRHHCRACGQVFCQQCSSKTSTLPKFGIEKEVRVCDACFDKVSRPPSSTAKLEIADSSSDYGPAQAQKRPPVAGGKSAEELQEEEELQLALALSQSEAEHKEKERKIRPHVAESMPVRPTISPSPSSVSASPEHSAANAELSRYLDRNYWEQRLNSAAPTAPASHTSEPAPAQPQMQAITKATTSKTSDDDAEDKEIDEFVDSLKSQIEIFVNRMKSNSSRGRSIANDTSVQTLFMNITAMHSRLLRYIQQQDDKRVYLESLQDKVTQIRDSRAALDTLRAEHAARVAAAAEAAERQRQMQMAAKLHAMRKKKHEYLQYQRQLALQRVQEQEREMQIRQEQQKHQYMMSSSGFYMPGVSLQQYQNYPGQPLYANPQYQMMQDPQVSQSMPSQISTAGTVSQSVPQLNNYPMTTSAVTLPQVSQQQSAPTRTQMGQLPMQQLMMQQMMRMPMQPGMHQMPQNASSIPGQLPQNGQGQIKPNMTQAQPANSMMTMPLPQQSMTQPIMNPNSAMAGMQMQNMRMPQMGNVNQPLNQQMSYPMNIQSQNNQPGLQGQSQQPQMSLPGQPMSLPGQSLPGQSPGQSQPVSLPNQIPSTNQNAPQGMQMPPQTQQSQIMQQPQPMMMQALQQPGQPMMLPGHQMLSTQNMQMNPQLMNQGQLPPPQMQNPQQMPQNTQQMQQNQQQMPQNQQQMPQNQQQMPQNQQQMQQMPQQMPQMPTPGHIPSQIAQQMQQIPQLQGQMTQMNQGQMPMQQPSQNMKMQQNVANGATPSQLPNTNQQAQQSQTTNVKTEHNNNTAELIHFD